MFFVYLWIVPDTFGAKMNPLLILSGLDSVAIRIKLIEIVGVTTFKDLISYKKSLSYLRDDDSDIDVLKRQITSGLFPGPGKVYSNGSKDYIIKTNIFVKLLHHFDHSTLGLGGFASCSCRMTIFFHGEEKGNLVNHRELVNTIFDHIQ